MYLACKHRHEPAACARLYILHVALDVLALGVMIPVLPGIVLEFMDGETAGAAEMFGAFARAWGFASTTSSWRLRAAVRRRRGLGDHLGHDWHVFAYIPT
jgi:archaellum biogenesis protein FlaJ (TadC family)